MKNNIKTKAQLIAELQEMRRRINELEKTDPLTKQVEEKQRKDQKKHKTYVENSPGALFVSDSSGRYLDVNRAACLMTGYSQKELLSMSIPDLVLPGSAAKIFKVFNKLKENQKIETEILVQKKDGTQIHSSLDAVALSDGSFLAFCFDITKRKQAEEALKEGEEKLRNFVEFTSLGIWCFQPLKPVSINIPEDQMIDEFFKSICIECNDTYASMMGVAKENILGLKLSDAMPDTDENRDYLRDFIKKGFKLSGGISRELTEDGKEKYFSNSMVGVIKNGKLINAWGTQIDVTERKQAEEALKKSEEQLRQIQKLEGIGQLAGGIAHDINNILTAMIGNTELALRGLKMGKNISNNLEQVMSGGRKAGELVTKILAFSRKQIIYPEVIDVNNTILNLAETLHRVISEDIKIKMDLNDNISLVKADPTQIEQILINLAVNAQDAIQQKKKPKTEKVITVETAAVSLDKEYVSSHIGSTIGPHILISVSDSGVGMNKEIINRIFEPFFTTKELGKGTGLGLSTVYGIVKQNHGSIYVYSEPGEGTTVKIYWPAFMGKTQPKKKVKGEKVKGGSETILFVEDDDKVRKASEQLLVLYGYKVLSTLNGRLALDLIKKKNIKIDMLVTDVVMPEMGGIELSEKLKKIYPGLKILYCSGYPDNQIVSAYGILNQDVNFIPKPYSSKELAKKIREILDKKAKN